MTINSIFPVVEGVEYGLFSTEMKRFEESVKAGENNTLTALFQVAQGSKMLAFTDKAFEAAGMPLFSWPERTAVYLTPVLLAVLKTASFVPEAVKSVAAFIQTHLTTLYQVACLVSSIALLFFGQLLFAIPSLVILGIGFLDRNGYLPVEFRQFLHQYARPLLTITSLFAGGILDRVFAALNILLYILNKCLSFNTHKKTLEDCLPHQQTLTFQKARDYLDGRFDLQINQKFIHYSPFPPIPDIDIQSFMEKFDSLDWAKHLTTLREKLRSDPRFIARHTTPDQKTDQELIDFAKTSLQAFITGVKERHVLEGEPGDYDKLHNYLKLIGDYVERQNDEVTQTDVLFRLAVEGGEYCGPGKFEVVESIYAQTIGENLDLSFEEKVLYCFQDERNLWIQKFYYTAYTASPVGENVGKILDWQDIHNYNIFVNLYGDEFGLRKAAADHDDLTVIDPLTKWIMGHTVNKTIQENFWKVHMIEDHAEILNEVIGTPRLPKPEVYAFWQDWIERQEIEEVQKQELRDELELGRLFGRDMEEDGQFKHEFVNLMMLDMGIAEEEISEPAELPEIAEPVQV